MMIRFDAVKTISLPVVLLFTSSSFTFSWTSPLKTNSIKKPFGIFPQSKSLANKEKGHRCHDIYPRTRSVLEASKQGVVDIFDRSTEGTTDYPLNFTGFVGNIPIFRLHINESFQLVPNGRSDQLIEWTIANNVTDLWVVSHGWLTSAEEAFSNNYIPLFSIFDKLEPQPQGKRFGIVGVTWNSVTEKAVVNKNTITSNGASNQNLDDANENLKPELIGMFSSTEEVESAWDLLEKESTSKGRFNRDILEYFTFRFMMGRAAQSGLQTLSPNLNRLRSIFPALRIHLIGHSFGALLVSAAANSGNPRDFASMTLLQGAFNTNSFSPTVVYQNLPGMFQSVLNGGKVRGPISVTHTKNDEVLTDLYYLAAEFFTDTWIFNDTLPFYGVEIPNFGSSPYSNNNIAPKVASDIRALGDEGVGNVPSQTQQWNTLAGYDPSKSGNKKFQSIDASDAISGHTDVWNEPVAQLLVKIANVSNYLE